MPISGTSVNCLAVWRRAFITTRWGSVAGQRRGAAGRIRLRRALRRTALFRLNKEEWLDVVRIGRRSFYRLSDRGLRLT
ncbi:hypothetical protein LNP74_21940 [Klebsiella pneumoniae subsp. pneumoniae]|nr:hypothetical protein [Klebsiella pneumoniae subsp. pneumoniae]